MKIYYINSDYAYSETLSDLFGEDFETDKATKEQCDKMVELGYAELYDTTKGFLLDFNAGYISDQGTAITFDSDNVSAQFDNFLYDSEKTIKRLVYKLCKSLKDPFVSEEEHSGIPARVVKFRSEDGDFEEVFAYIKKVYIGEHGKVYFDCIDINSEEEFEGKTIESGYNAIAVWEWLKDIENE